MTDLPPPPPPPPFSPTPSTQFRKTGGLGTALFVLMIISAVASGLLLVAAADRFNSVSEAQDDIGSFSLTRASELDDAVENAYGLVALAGLVVFILLIIFLYRLVVNTRNDGGQLRHSNGMAIGGFFIPLANIFIPYRLFIDVIRHLQARRPGNKRVTVVMNLWWWGYFAAFFFIQIAAAIDTESLDDLQTSDSFLVVGALTMLIATVFGAVAVRRIARLSRSVFGG